MAVSAYKESFMAFEYAIALTGGIATGKSTVASLLGLSGLRIIDADKISHTILDQNADWVKEHFGEAFITSRGKVERSALGKVVFADEEKKKELESFLHPLIREEIRRQSEKQDSFKYPYLIDIPLFFEGNAYNIKDSVVVYTPADVQLERFMKRNGFSEEESLRRIGSQMPIDEKKAKATWVIDNSQNLKHLQKECYAFVDDIKAKYPAPKK